MSNYNFNNFHGSKPTFQNASLRAPPPFPHNWQPDYQPLPLPPQPPMIPYSWQPDQPPPLPPFLDLSTPPPPLTHSRQSIPLSTPINQGNDQEYIKKYEANITQRPKIRPNATTLAKLKSDISELVRSLHKVVLEQRILVENKDTFTDEKWEISMKRIKDNKSVIEKVMQKLSGFVLDMSRRVIAKRLAKRQRLKRLRAEKKRGIEERRREMAERSRKIDENLQKIKDDIHRTKQEEETKLQADIVLKDVLRKKHDAKKCLVKLEALLKLRRARQNTARGRGETVSESDNVTFQNNIEKLKSLWAKKLVAYEHEETDLRSKLCQDNAQEVLVTDTEKRLRDGLQEWRDVMFGGGNPQKVFGNMEEFVVVRREWDRYISEDGTPLPIGWVLPTKRA